MNDFTDNASTHWSFQHTCVNDKMKKGTFFKHITCMSLNCMHCMSISKTSTMHIMWLSLYGAVYWADEEGCVWLTHAVSCAPLWGYKQELLFQIFTTLSVFFWRVFSFFFTELKNYKHLCLCQWFNDNLQLVLNCEVLPHLNHIFPHI